VDVPLSTSTTVASRDELFIANEQLALAGFVAGFSGLTLDAYTLDLRQYVAWCTEHQLAVFGARRADIECFPPPRVSGPGSRHDRATAVQCTVSCFYRYAEQEGLIATSPAAHVRRPGLNYESPTTGLDATGRRHARGGGAGQRPGSRADQPARPQRAAGLRSDRHGYRGPRAGAWHRTLTILRKSGKVVTIPLAPRTARAIDLVVGERCEGPIQVASTGERIDRHAAGRIVRRVARHAGISKRVGPHTLRHALSPGSGRSARRPTPLTQKSGQTRPERVLFVCQEAVRGRPLRDQTRRHRHRGPRAGVSP
jgi:integrase/recombinase XerD